ncbi:DNA polymerase III, alpha subunit [Rhizobiales bacterium GAS188]|nr:DNA polymerase III, alpha subunit [Rhizobiales bacterium GAS188]
MALDDVGFVHLHVHSSYSLLEGALPIAKLAKLARADKMPALALTDTNNLYGALEFSEKLAGEGIQPIVGLQLSVDFGDADRTRQMRKRIAAIVLLATSAEGYANLLRLSSRALVDTANTSGRPHLPFEQIEAFANGLIALTGGPDGPIDEAIGERRLDLAEARLERLMAAFGSRLYIEIQRHGLPMERAVEPTLLDFAYRRAIPIVATNEPYFAGREDHEAHDALLAIAEGRLVSDDARRHVTAEHGFKSRAEMMATFADLPEALRNSVEIALRCSFRPRATKPILPRFSGEGTSADEDAELDRQAAEGLQARLAAHGFAPGLTREDYDARLAFELGVIKRMTYSGYFLIVSDFIKHAKSRGIPVGPGRGSGAGSLVAWSLMITDLDPMRFSLLFERFLNPDRVSMPDFDVDFCMNRREEVIDYVRERYGADRVAQIITFGTLQARGVMRDVGRVLEMPYGQVDKLTKLVPQNPANPIPLKVAIETEPRLSAEAKADPRVGRMLDIAQKLEGLHRHASTHAAGIVIGDRPLEEVAPLTRDPRSGMLVTQFNMKWVEPAGLVKFDFLGLRTLTILQTAVELIARRGIKVELAAIPLDDRATFEMLQRGETVGVFQVEGSGMRRALVDMRADRFEDLIALVALYRPGPMANIPVYCARKRGDEPVEVLHPKLEPLLRETFGVITYQEQVQQIARELAGYSLAEADLLRRAMGKKIKAEMDAQRGRFLQGAKERGIPPATAEAVFDACAKFAEYGFNKSHSAPYALLTYQTAYLKANHPVEFLAASMTHEMSNTDKLGEFRQECARLGIKLEPPSINRSGVLFEPAEGAIRYALAAIKGMGGQAAEAIVAARGQESGGQQSFRDLADFARRFDPKIVNRRALETLICAGALDDLGPDRAASFASVEAVIALAQANESDRQSGQGSMFGGASTTQSSEFRMANAPSWTASEKLKREFAAIGFFISGHPLDEYKDVLKRLNVLTYAAFAKGARAGRTSGRLAGAVLDRTERRTKSGSKMGIVLLSDATAQFECVLFSEGLARYRPLLETGSRVLVEIKAGVEGEELRVRIETVELLDDAAARIGHSLRLYLRDACAIEPVARCLSEPGDSQVSLIAALEPQGREVEIKLPGRYRTTPEVAGAIKAVPGVLAVEMV